MGIHSSPNRRGGLPHWLLFACIPVVLALGFVAGLALAAYRPATATPAPTQGTDTVATGTGSEPAQAATSSPRPDSSWRIVTTGAGSATAGTQTEPWDSSDPADKPGGSNSPSKPTAFNGPATNVLEARQALQSDYSIYKAGSNTISVEYQLMRQEASSSQTTLVGVISADSYSAWAAALRSDPAGLAAWLQAAAGRVQDAAIRDRFFIAWAVVETMRDPPEGYAPHEVTPLDNRSWLVVRPLAATRDFTKTEISLRPLASLQAAVAGQKVTSGDPWSAYGPKIRFDATDLWRPIQTTGALPLSR